MRRRKSGVAGVSRKMDKTRYLFEGREEMITPVLLYYKDYITENIKKAIRMAGDSERLWPHVKTHKTRELISLLIDHGITRFKCATIAEAEITASCGPSDLLLAYPLVGPNISRFLALQREFPGVRFWAIGDDPEHVRQLGTAALAAGMRVRFLADVNVGQNRTGVPFERLISFYEEVSAIEGLEPDGFHCYDGHIHQSSYAVRSHLASEITERTLSAKKELTDRGYSCSVLVMGGTPTFPCYAAYPDVYLSPGTIFLSDYGYASSYREMDFIPAGIIMTRVISRPASDTFTLDLGYKGIAADPDGVRGVILGMEETAVSLFQSEEHWVFRIAAGHEDEIPPIGSELFVVPTHICPSTALYPFVPVVEQGRVTECWEIAARNRRVTL